MCCRQLPDFGGDFEADPTICSDPKDMPGCCQAKMMDSADLAAAKCAECTARTHHEGTRQATRTMKAPTRPHAPNCFAIRRTRGPADASCPV